MSTLFTIVFVCLSCNFCVLTNGCEHVTYRYVKNEPSSTDSIRQTLLLTQNAIHDHQDFVEESCRLLTLPTLSAIQRQQQHQNQLAMLIPMLTNYRAVVGSSLLSFELKTAIKLGNQLKLALQALFDFNGLRIDRFWIDYFVQKRQQNTTNLFEQSTP